MGPSVWTTSQRWRSKRRRLLSLTNLSDEEIWLLVQRGLGYAAGETLHDTGRVLSGMLDLFVARTASDPAELAMLASQDKMVVINSIEYCHLMLAGLRPPRRKNVYGVLWASAHYALETENKRVTFGIADYIVYYLIVGLSCRRIADTADGGSLSGTGPT
jgi:hypothetical protein